MGRQFLWHCLQVNLYIFYDTLNCCKRILYPTLANRPHNIPRSDYSMMRKKNHFPVLYDFYDFTIRVLRLTNKVPNGRTITVLIEFYYSSELWSPSSTKRSISQWVIFVDKTNGTNATLLHRSLRQTNFKWNDYWMDGDEQNISGRGWVWMVKQTNGVNYIVSLVVSQNLQKNYINILQQLKF